MGPQTKAADELHAMKYREPNESFKDCINRVAFRLKDDDEHYHQLREILLDMRFMPAGRIQNAIGSSRDTTPYNCYVSGTIMDSAVEGDGNIFQRVSEAFATMRMGGGIGYNFGTLRPRGSLIKKLGSVSSGPMAFMEVFDAACRAAQSAGHRRGAQMGVMPVHHPDIEEFILIKQNDVKLKGFNISVAITNEFMEAVEAGKSFDLRFNGEVYRTIDALELWEKIMRATWDYADPGVLFIDRINEENNLNYIEEIAATNPCGEQPLPPFGACLLGSFNAVKYLRPTPTPREVTAPAWYFDWDQLDADIEPIVRAMDNIIDRAKYPLAKQRAEAITKRRMGLGITGLANAAEALGFPYASRAFLDFQDKLGEAIAMKAYLTSIDLAKEKGPFPLFEAEKYGNCGWARRLPSDVKDMIRKYGIRNSHLTSIAPTGTISLCADNISSGLEPVFAYSVDRPINTPEGQIIAKVEDYGVAFLNTRGRLCDEITAQEHVSVLTNAQKWIDSAVSKTVNMDSKTMPWEDFKNIYLAAYRGGAKGCTTFNKSGKRGAMMVASSSEKADGPVCVIDPESGLKECG